MKKTVFLLVFCVANIGWTSAQTYDSSNWNAKDYVDLGLPSGTLWASCNVGASSPEEFGNYYAWGETEIKNYYYHNTYLWCDGNDIYHGITKYCVDGSFGDVDNITTLDATDDVAFLYSKGECRMPSSIELDELMNSCTWTWTQFNNIYGYTVTGSNGNSIFLPATGWIVGDEIRGLGDSWGTRGCYWTSSLSIDKNCDGLFLSFYPNEIELGGSIRHCGHTIRPVKNKTVLMGEDGNISWTLDSTSGILTLSGSGSMYDYGVVKKNDKDVTSAPWGEHYSLIKEVKIQHEITSIGTFAFAGCSNMTTITIPESVTSVAGRAFDDCI